jgi:hypothetical protein
MPLNEKQQGDDNKGCTPLSEAKQNLQKHNCFDRLTKWLRRNLTLSIIVAILIGSVAIGISVYNCHQSASQGQHADIRGEVAAFKEDLSMAKTVIDAKQARNENIDALQGNYTEAEDRYGAANRALATGDYDEAENDIKQGISYLDLIKKYASSTSRKDVGVSIIASPSFLSVYFDLGNATGVTKEGNQLRTISISAGFSAAPAGFPQKILGNYVIQPEAFFDKPIDVTFYYWGSLPRNVSAKDLVLVTQDEDSGQWTALNSEATTGSITTSVNHLTEYYLVLAPNPKYPWWLPYPIIAGSILFLTALLFLANEIGRRREKSQA